MSEAFSRVIIDQNKLKEAKDFYDNRIVGWMIADLKKSIGATTNFLTALGCVTYTEFLGRFAPPIDGERGKPEERCFYRALNRFPSAGYLERLEEFIHSQIGKNYYQGIRHGLVHYYGPQLSKQMSDGNKVFWASMIALDGMINDGRFNKKSAPIFIDNKGWVVLATRNYVEELEITTQNFMQITFEKKDQDFQKAAIAGIDYMARGVKHA